MSDLKQLTPQQARAFGNLAEKMVDTLYGPPIYRQLVREVGFDPLVRARFRRFAESIIKVMTPRAGTIFASPMFASPSAIRAAAEHEEKLIREKLEKGLKTP